MARTSSSFDLELLDESPSPDVLVGLMLVSPTDDEGKPINGAPKTIADLLAAQTSDAPLGQQLETRVQESWHGGLGIDYDQAPGVYTRSPDFACPAGKSTAVSVIGFAQATTGPLVEFVEFLGSLYIAQEGKYDTVTPANSLGGRVLKLTGGAGAAATVSLAGPSGTGLYANGPANGASVELVRSVILADNGSGVTCLYASSETVGRTGGRLHMSTDGTTWVSTTTAGAEWGAGRGLGQMVTVDWTTDDGITDRRIVAVTGAKTIAYTLPNANPQGAGGAGTMTAAWSPDIKIKCSGTITKLVAFRRHVFVVTTDNVYDLNELGESTALTSYLPGMQSHASAGTLGAIGFGGHIYLGVGTGVMRVYVGDQGVLNESPTEAWCSPGWRTASRASAAGYATDFCIDQGYIVVSIHQPTLAKTSIYYGIPKETVGIEAPQPLIWYGPEITFSVAYRVSRMHVSNLAGADDLRLWIGSQNTGGATVLHWVSLPVAGTPIQDIAATGDHRFTTDANDQVCQPTSYLESLLDSWDDKSQTKILYQWSVGTEGTLAQGDTRLRLDTRADPAPGSATYVTGSDVITGPVQTITPTTTVSGAKTQWRMAFFTPTSTNPPILDSVRAVAIKRAPSIRVVSVQVQYGDDTPNLHGVLEKVISPDTITARLLAMTSSARLTLRDRNDQRWIVVLRQVLDGGEELSDRGTWGKKVNKRLDMMVLGSA